MFASLTSEQCSGGHLRERELIYRHAIMYNNGMSLFCLRQVADTFTLTPPKIERHFGITGGHIHHIDNSFGFDQRFPCATPVPGLYSASAGACPACMRLGGSWTGGRSQHSMARRCSVSTNKHLTNLINFV